MLNELILETHDKASIHRIIDYVGTNPKHLKELLDVFLVTMHEFRSKQAGHSVILEKNILKCFYHIINSF